MLGLAFKDETDDLRESPNVDLAQRLLKAGFDLAIHDPTIDPATLLGRNLSYSASQLPELARLLVDARAVESGAFDRIVDTNGRRRGMNLPAAELIDLNALK
jgi:GDP-mannose 6-dehydrogenase